MVQDILTQREKAGTQKVEYECVPHFLCQLNGAKSVKGSFRH